MSSRVMSCRQYNLKTELPVGEARSLVNVCLDDSLDVVREIKNNERNFAARVDDGSQDGLIVKVSRKRNRRIWERLLTLFRDGESFRVFDSHQQLRELDFCCPEPVLAAERRVLGVAVDGFVMYRHLPGRPASEGDAANVSGGLMALHEKGFTRGDPKAINFLICRSRVAFIDFRLSRPLFFKKHHMRMEYAHLLLTLPEAEQYLPQEERNAPGFRFVVWLLRAISDVKRKKRDWRARIKHGLQADGRHGLSFSLILTGSLFVSAFILLGAMGGGVLYRWPGFRLWWASGESRYLSL